jgi:hypothetical protein
MTHGFGSSRPERAQNFFRSANFQIPGQLRADRRTQLGLASQFIADQAGPVLAGNKSTQPQYAVDYFRKASKGHLATPAQGAAHGSFRFHALCGFQMMQWLH